MATQVALPAAWQDSVYQFNLFDHFDNISATRWTEIETVGATVAIDADGVGGIVLCTTGGNDDDDCYIHSTQELILMAGSKGFKAICRMDFAEANTDDANVIFGLANAVAADELTDDGGGPATGKNNAVIYKVFGETVWRCGAALAAGTFPANKSDESAGRTNSETSSFQTLMIDCKAKGGSRDPNNAGTQLSVTYHVDPRGFGGFRQLKDTNGNLIEDVITLGTATEMQLFAGARAGSANSEVVKIDYMGVSAVL